MIDNPTNTNMSAVIPSLKELADYLGVSDLWLRRAIAAGEVPPARRVGRKYLWLRRSIDEWIVGGGKQAA